MNQRLAACMTQPGMTQELAMKKASFLGRKILGDAFEFLLGVVVVEITSDIKGSLQLICACTPDSYDPSRKEPQTDITFTADLITRHIDPETI